MPIGFYRRISSGPIHRGDIVAACLSRPLEKVGLARGYLTPGTCPYGAAPVIKEVIAVPGDRVIVRRQAIIVNGKAYFAPQLLRDSVGRQLTRWVHIGTQGVSRGYWLYGVGDPKQSWDSRYYEEFKTGV